MPGERFSEGPAYDRSELSSVVLTFVVVDADPLTSAIKIVCVEMASW